MQHIGQLLVLNDPRPVFGPGQVDLPPGAGQLVDFLVWDATGHSAAWYQRLP
jgi:hypothetical protein